MNLQEKGCGLEWIDTAQGWERWLAFLKVAMNV
jgi:hypothetical protein